MQYYVVMLSYPARYVDGVRISVAGREAIVDPEVTRREVISRIRSGEYARDEIEFIHHITMNDAPHDVTAEFLAQAELDNFAETTADRMAGKWDRDRDERKHMERV